MDPRIKSNLDSIENIIDLLRRILINPAEFKKNDYLISALASQGKLAAFNSPDFKVKKMSLNTFKYVCENYIIGGFEKVDGLRKQSHKAITQTSSLEELKGNAPQSSRLETIIFLKGNIDALSAANLILLNSLKKSLDALNDISKSDNSNYRHRAALETRTSILASLAKNPPPFDTDSSGTIYPIR